MKGTTDIREWISSTLGDEWNPEGSLAQSLKSGVVLCNLMNKIHPGSIKTINTNNMPVAFKENIGSFLRSCQSLGLEEVNLFDITDLYDERNIDLVVSTLTVLQNLSSKDPADAVVPTSPKMLCGTVPLELKLDSTENTDKKPKKNAKYKLESFFMRRASSSPNMSADKEKVDKKKGSKLQRSLEVASAPTPTPASPTVSPPPSPTQSALFRVPSSELRTQAEIAKLRDDCEKLHADRKLLKERVGFAYPEKYRSFVMFDEVLKKDDLPNFTVPDGTFNESDYLKAEEAKLLNDIFTLTSMLAIVEENRGLRIRMAELQKMVDMMITEKKRVSTRVEELLTPAAPTPEPPAEPEGLVLSEYKGKPGEIKGGTAEKLLERLYTTSIAGSVVSEYVDIFLLTYRSFITPKKVLEMLTQTFLTNRTPSTPTPEEESSDTTTIQVQQDKLMRLRICNFLKRWVESYFEDFDQDLIAAFQGFIDACQEDHLVVLLKKTLEKKLSGVTQGQRQFVFDTQAPMTVLPRTPATLTYSQEDWEPIELARQLTIIEHDLYREITPKELHSLSWQKSDREKKSPNLLKMIHRFNEVSNWVQWQVVSEPNLKKRVNMVKRMIKVAEELKKLNNFNAVFVIVSAMHSASVNRMRKTWEEVPKSFMKQLEEYDALTSPNSSYRNYRLELHNANPPCIPYVGVYLSDLTFIEEGNPDCLENGYINFFKRRMIAEVIKEIQQYQQAPYNLTPVPTVQKYLTNHKMISDNDMFQRSLVSEPREAYSVHY